MVHRLAQALAWMLTGLLLSGCAHRLWVFEGPATLGPFPVGQVELNDPDGISGITDPTGLIGPTQKVTLAWARIMYPATTAGTGTIVSTVRAHYPVALFLHGRHFKRSLEAGRDAQSIRILDLSGQPPEGSRQLRTDSTERNSNTLLGAVTAPGFATFEERLLNFDSSRYPPGLPTDFAFFHDTLGLKLAWTAPQTYTTNIPAPHRNVSKYKYLTIRAAKKVSGLPTAGPGVALFINIEDGAGRTGLVAGAK